MGNISLFWVKCLHILFASTILMFRWATTAGATLEKKINWGTRGIQSLWRFSSGVLVLFRNCYRLPVTTCASFVHILLAWSPGSLTTSSRARWNTNLPVLWLVNTRTALWRMHQRFSAIFPWINWSPPGPCDAKHSRAREPVLRSAKRAPANVRRLNKRKWRQRYRRSTG